MFRNQKGQLTIFLGIIMIILITMLAFIVNVGLFVKAKINLQNSVDAAAWSGAAVQARQLSAIGYLNWELRNTYKEWLFKYYVVGTVSLAKTKLAGGHLPQPPARHAQNNAQYMNFRQDPFDPSGTLMGDTGAPKVDPYNAPSICMHYGTDDICQIYSVPGLPRFDPVGLPGPSEAHEAFVNVLDQKKSQDCSLRSNLNFMTALIWTYGTEQDIPGGNYIASNRPGAWVQAMELALRVRNMEYLVNAPPKNRVCQGGAGCTPLSAFGKLGDERTIKAFSSAYRNLSEELQSTFVMDEIAPQPYTFTDRSLSGSLYMGHTEKHYLDLQIIPLNYIIFFTAFIRSDGSYSGNLQSTAQCDSSKMALPVPGYVTGFTKNPRVMTYYAVKGEAYFSGLFFPFTSNNGILLKAYAAAKPFGGRIGPYLFAPDADEMGIKARGGTNHRSLPYISTLDDLPVGANYVRGYPIPLQNFWIRNSDDIVGGVPGNNANAMFGIPNMAYDYESSLDELKPNTAETFLKLQRAMTMEQGGVKPGVAWGTTESLGLYNQSQFRAFARNLKEVPPGGDIDATTLEEAIMKARRPTKYEALNYLIPFCKPEEVGDSYDLETPPNVSERCTSANGVVRYSLFAPLFGDDALYPGPAEAKGEVMTYLFNSSTAIDNFLASLKDTANAIRAQGSTTTAGPAAVEDAANTISRQDPGAECGSNGISTANGLSMAARFHIFFKGNGVSCQITPLQKALEQYWGEKVNSSPDFANYFSTSFVAPEDGHPSMNKFLTAFMPGLRQGAGDDAQIISPFGGSTGQTFAKRNFYSTKFVALKNLVGGQGYADGGVSKYKESSNLGDSPDGLPSESFENKLNSMDLSEFGPLHY